MTLNQRLDALEHQMSDMLRQSEENGNRLHNVESGLGQLKTDEDQRISALEQRVSDAAAAATAVQPSVGPEPRPASGSAKTISAWLENASDRTSSGCSGRRLGCTPK